MNRYVHRQLCAASVNGCRSFLEWESSGATVDQISLLLKGWRLDRGKWICPNHAKREGQS